MTRPDAARPIPGPWIRRARRRFRSEPYSWSRPNQAEFAGELGVSRATVSRWENEGAPLLAGFAVVGFALTRNLELAVDLVDDLSQWR